MTKMKKLLIALIITGMYSQTFSVGHFYGVSWEEIVEGMQKSCGECKPSCCSVVTDTLDHRIKGQAKVATDNTDQPVYMAYATQGTQEPNKPTVIFADTYFGINGMKCAQEALKNCYYTVSVDPIGFGQSSKPDPTVMDGVKGFPGYSFDQTAAIMHKFISQLNIKPPIIFVGVDAQGHPAMKYAVRYASDPLAITKLVLLDTGPSGIVGDDPCRLTFLTTAEASGLADFFEADPCTAGCALLSVSFSDTACPTYASEINNESVNYFAPLPPAIFRRLFTQAFVEDVSSLMAEIEIPVLYLYGVVDQTDMLSRKASGIAFMGYCPSCSLNPTTTGICPCDTPAIAPFTDIQFLTFAGKGTGLWLTDHKKFMRALKNFITGCDIQCCPCPRIIGNPVVCPVCPPV